MTTRKNIIAAYLVAGKWQPTCKHYLNCRLKLLPNKVNRFQQQQNKYLVANKLNKQIETPTSTLLLPIVCSRWYFLATVVF